MWSRRWQHSRRIQQAQGSRAPVQRLVDQVVVENATLPLADLYFALKEESQNRGEVDYDALIAGKPQALRLVSTKASATGVVMSTYVSAGDIAVGSFAQGGPGD